MIQSHRDRLSNGVALEIYYGFKDHAQTHPSLDLAFVFQATDKAIGNLINLLMQKQLFHVN